MLVAFLSDSWTFTLKSVIFASFGVKRMRFSFESEFQENEIFRTRVFLQIQTWIIRPVLTNYKRNVL